MTNDFFSLTPDLVLDAVEDALDRSASGRRATGRTLILNSLENRVYELEFEDGLTLVAKFYRPGRWTEPQLIEEHRFLSMLNEAEVPVVLPVTLAKTLCAIPTLGRLRIGIYFVLFPKVRGRLLDELTETQLQTMGRTIARIHAVGSKLRATSRFYLDVETFGWKSLELISRVSLGSPEWFARYRQVAEAVLNRIEPFFDDVPYFAIHGDCHLGNTLWQGDAPFFLDFDDMLLGPAVQDLWMVVRGRDAESIDERNQLIEAYEEFYPFDRSTLDLIEPLRALRMINYASWIATRWDDPYFKRVFPHFGSDRYWSEEIEALQQVLEFVG